MLVEKTQVVIARAAIGIRWDVGQFRGKPGRRRVVTFIVHGKQLSANAQLLLIVQAGNAFGPILGLLLNVLCVVIIVMLARKIFQSFKRHRKPKENPSWRN